MRLTLKLSAHTFQSIIDYIEVRKALFGEDVSVEDAIGEMSMISKNQLMVAKARSEGKKIHVNTTGRTAN